MSEIAEEKESLSKFVDKKYEIEENKKDLEEEIRQQELNIKVLQELKRVEEVNTLQQEKIKISQNTIKEYERKIDEICYSKNEQPEKKNKRNLNIINVIMSLVLVILSIISVIIIKNDIISATTIVLAVISVLYTGYEQYKKKLAVNNTKETEDIDNEKIKTKIEVMQTTIEALQKEQQELEKKAQTEYKKELEKIRNAYMGIIPIKVIDELLSKKQVKFEIEVANNKIAEDKLKIQSIGLDRGNIMPKLENLASLEEEYTKLEEEYKELSFQNEAIELAKQELENAYYQMKKRVTPHFTNNLSEIMKRISNGKYTNIKLDEKDGLIVEIQNGDYIPVEYLSIGTIDQLYLSLRLGAASSISNENLPIILDETFAYYDEKRLKNILEFLHTEYENKQIIILTCTKREKDILQKEGINYNYIEL